MIYNKSLINISFRPSDYFVAYIAFPKIRLKIAKKINRIRRKEKVKAQWAEKAAKRRAAIAAAEEAAERRRKDREEQDMSGWQDFNNACWRILEDMEGDE